MCLIDRDYLIIHCSTKAHRNRGKGQDHALKDCYGSWRGSSGFKALITVVEARFDSQHPHGDLQPSVTPGLGDLTPPSALYWY